MKLSRVWWLKFIISELSRWGPEDYYKLETTLTYITSTWSGLHSKTLFQNKTKQKPSFSHLIPLKVL